MDEVEKMNELKKEKKLSKFVVLIALITVLVLILPSNLITAESSFSDSLAEAILSDPTCLSSSSYSDEDQYANRQVAILSSHGTMKPTEGSEFILLSTGIAGVDIVTNDDGEERGKWFNGGQRGNPRDEAILEMVLDVPESMNFLYYDVQFFSTEYPDYDDPDTSYNDIFTASIYAEEYEWVYKWGIGWVKELTWSQLDNDYIDVQSGHFIKDSNDISGTGFDVFAIDENGNPTNPDQVDLLSTTPHPGTADAGATNVYRKGFAIPSDEEKVKIKFSIMDEGDNQFDSAAFIDNVRFSEYEQANIQATKESSINSTHIGDTITYTITIDNTGLDQEDNPDLNEFIDYIPENTAYVDSSAEVDYKDKNPGTIEYDGNINAIIWNGVIYEESSFTISFDVTITGQDSANSAISNQADVYWEKNQEYIKTNWANISIISTPPVAINDTISVNEDESVYIDVLSNDYDPHDVSFRIYNYSQPLHGSITENDNGTFLYTPDENFYGTDSFNYSIIHILADDEDGLENEIDSAQVTITVEQVNDPPIVEDIPGQNIFNGKSFDQIPLDEYVDDPDNTEEEIVWTVTARTLWVHKETNELVASGYLYWVEIKDRKATISYPENESLWGKPEPAEDYEPYFEGASFVFEPQFNATDPEGLVSFTNPIFTVYPSSITETFENDQVGNSASQSFGEQIWFSTGPDGLGCNFEVADAFNHDSTKSFKTKIRKDGSPLYWNYSLDKLGFEFNLTAWEIWFYCGNVSKESKDSDLKLEFRDDETNIIAKIFIEYDHISNNLLGWAPKLMVGSNEYQLNSSYSGGYLFNGWYHLRIEQNETERTDYILSQANQDSTKVTITDKSFSGLDKIEWTSSNNAVVCPMFFWDDHVIELSE